MRARSVLSLLLLTACGAAPAQAPPPVLPPVCAAAPAPPGPLVEAARHFADPHPVAAFADPERKAKLVAAAAGLDRQFAEYAARVHIPGMVAGLVVDGELVWSRGYGVKDVTTKEPVDADTVFRLASVTKSFTAIAVLQLRDAGKLLLDDPAEKYLPELAGIVYPTRDAARITVRNLLTHTAGLPHDAPLPGDDAHAPLDSAVLQSLQGMVLERPPSAAYSYSNLGFQLLGMVVARVAGTTYAEYLGSHVLQPLGMTSTGFDPPPSRLAWGYVLHGDGVEHPPMIQLGPFPAGGLFSSARDLARYAALQLSAWPPRDDTDTGPLRRSSLREAQRMATWMGLQVPHRKIGKRPSAIADGYGFGWVQEQTCDFDQVFWHNGALSDGYRAMLMLLPDRGVALLVLANLFDDDMELEDAVRGGAYVLEESGALAKRVLQPSPALLAARDAVVSLRARWDDALAVRTFPTEVAPRLPEMKKGMEEGARDHGACRVGATSVDGRSRLEWDMACDRGGEHWEIELDAKGERIGWIRGDDRFPPDPRLAKAAPSLAGLVAHWDDRVFDAQMVATKESDRAKVKAVFGEAEAEHGSCKVDHADERGDKTHGRFVLKCNRGGPLEMVAVLDDKSGKVTSVTLGEPRQEGKSCP